MDEHSRFDTPGHCGPACRCHGGSADVSRRRFFGLSAAAASAAILAAHARDALAAGKLPDQSLVPADKGQAPATGLYARGIPTSYTGSDLRYIGMPVGGGCCGQVYLGGDGRLWYWDVDNGPAAPGADGGGETYASPREPFTPFGNGLVLKVTAGGPATARRVDGSGFDQITFTGQYPIGQVDYRAGGFPVTARLEAFSPFIPGNVDDSTLPVTVLACTLTNTSSRPVEAELTGWAENPVCLRSRSAQPISLSSGPIEGGSGATVFRGVEFSAAQETLPPPR
jgi:beta-glucosidase 2, glycosyl-hydrolase family 116 N-term